MAQRISLLVVSIAAAAFAMGNVLLWQELRDERKVADELRTQLAKQSVANVPTLAGSTPAPTPAPTPVDTARAPAPVTAQTTAPKAQALAIEDQATRDWRARQERLMADPRYREEMRRQARMGLNVHRSLALNLLGMSEAQADGALDLWADYENNRRMRQQLMPNGGPTRDQREAEERSYEDSLVALLGEQQAAKWKHYRESLPTRMRVTQLQSRLNGEHLLREDQIEPLIEAMEVEQSQLRKALNERRDRYYASMQASPLDPRDYMAEEIEMFTQAKKRVLSAASPILSAAQLDRLDTMYEQEIESRRSSLRMSQLQDKIMQDSSKDAN